ncbi:MAG: phasin family protein [Hyphomonadaceae bacterium]
MAKAKSTANAKTDTFETFASAPAEALTKSMEQVMAFSGQFGEMGRDNLQAMGQSVKATAAGVEAINARSFAFMKSAMERNLEAMNAFASVKSVEELTTKQSELATGNIQTMMSEFSALSTLFTDTLRDAAAPLNAQAGIVAEKLQSAG